MYVDMCQVNSSGTTMGPLADIWQTSGIDIGGGDHAGTSGRYLEHLWNTSGTPLEVFPEVFQRSARYLTEVPISIPGRSQFTWNMLQKVFQRSSRGVPEVLQRSARGLPEVFQRSKNLPLGIRAPITPHRSAPSTLDLGGLNDPREVSLWVQEP